MGYQPLVKDMPVRLTVTDHKRKDKMLLKNSRWALHGWELHAVDEERFKNCATMEMVVQYMPESLYIRLEGAKWVESPELGPGIAEIKPQHVVWALDKNWQFKVERYGFCIASDFSGTAHSFVGATLAAAITDCGAWDDVPSRGSQLSGYMCASRVEYVDNLCFAQPFCPTYFSQGDLPGPDLFLRFWQGLLATDALHAAWTAEMKRG